MRFHGYRGGTWANPQDSIIVLERRDLMFHRTAIFMTAALALACSTAARADAPPQLSLDPAVITAADITNSQGALMRALEDTTLGNALADAKLTIDGWIETGYTLNHHHGSDNYEVIIPGPFNHEHGNHYMLNQAVVRIAREVDAKKFDVGGMIEFMYGSDAARIHAWGLGYDGSDPSDDGLPDDPDSASQIFATINNYNPINQFDIPQAYLTVNLPVGNGLQLMVGKFATLLGYESFNAVSNPLYSHSYLFSNVPFTHTGILGSYEISDQLGVKLGITRGWDTATEDNNAALDVIGRVSFKINTKLNLDLNYSVGPEDTNDNGHYRVAIDPILRWEPSSQLQLGLEALYVYDGGRNAVFNGSSAGHAYGDFWGAALYGGFKINDNFSLNARAEYAHNYLDSLGDLYDVHNTIYSIHLPALSIYEITLGVTITPLPKFEPLRGLTIRPELRYDFTDSAAFKFFPGPRGSVFKDQLTFACDVLFQF
jgi:hypothetical protein